MSNTYLTPIVFVFCVVGTYALNNNILDIFMMMIFGVVAYVLIKCDFPMPPIILGLILGSLAEKNLQRALVISDGNISVFFTLPHLSGPDRDLRHLPAVACDQPCDQKTSGKSGKVKGTGYPSVEKMIVSVWKNEYNDFQLPRVSKEMGGLT